MVVVGSNVGKGRIDAKVPVPASAMLAQVIVNTPQVATVLAAEKTSLYSKDVSRADIRHIDLALALPTK